MPNRVHIPTFIITSKDLALVDHTIAKLENEHPEILRKWTEDIERDLFKGSQNDNM